MSLQKIQERLKSPKSNYNNFGKYSYRSIEDIQEALKPVLAEYKYSLTISDDIVLIGDRYYVKSTATLCDDKGKVVAENTAFAREPADQKGMQPAQISGATSSYSRKYCLGGMFLLDDTKDADSHDNSNTPSPKPKQPMNQPAPRTDEQFNTILELGKKNKLNKTDIGKVVKWKTNNAPLSKDMASLIIKDFNAVCDEYAVFLNGPPEY